MLSLLARPGSRSLYELPRSPKTGAVLSLTASSTISFMAPSSLLDAPSRLTTNSSAKPYLPSGHSDATRYDDPRTPGANEGASPADVIVEDAACATMMPRSPKLVHPGRKQNQGLSHNGQRHGFRQAWLQRLLAAARAQSATRYLQLLLSVRIHRGKNSGQLLLCNPWPIVEHSLGF